MTPALSTEPALAIPGRAQGWGARGRWLPLVLLVWVAICALFLSMNAAAISAVEFRDPDDQLRLVQVRDLIAGQGWFDITQHRVDSDDGGVAMHWSRLVDVPIAAVILLLRPLFGQAAAELAALLAIPALTLLAILALVGWMASRTLDRRALFPALLAMGLAAPVIVQVMPLRIDHHGWQIVLALLAVAAFLHPDPRRGGWISGAALATWMAISFEGLPFSAWFIAVLALWALIDPAMRGRLVATMQALAAASLALFLATRGLGDLAQHCDAIAPVHLAMFAWGALAISVPAALRPHSRIALGAGLGLAAAGALALVALAAPQCTTGSFDMLDPVVRAYWYDNVPEGKPLWQAQWHLMAQYLLPPLIGLHPAAALAGRTEGAERRWWLFYALVLMGAIAISLLVTRSAAYSGALAALPLGWRLAGWIGGLRRPANPLLRIGELVGVAALVFCALVPSVPALAVESLFGDKVAEREDQDSKLACAVPKARDALDALPAGAILAPLDFGPNLLLNSRKGVLATGHHRGATAMRAVIDAFTGSPERAREVMRRHALRYVVICPGVQEMNLYRSRAPGGFAAQMLAGKAPAWLRPVPMPQASGLRMWELAD